MARNKYGNKTTLLFGIKFQSQEEAWRYPVLLERVQNGEISDLRLQPRYEVFPAFHYRGALIQAIHYSPDFDYLEQGIRVAEDVKGVATTEFKLKQKLFQKQFPNIELRVIKSSAEESPMPPVFDLQHNYISDSRYDSLRTSNITAMFEVAHTLANPWRIVRPDGIVIACSYDLFTSIEQAQKNGRLAA